MKISKNGNSRNIAGKKLRELRKRSNFSQNDLAREVQLKGLNLTSKEISKIETNNRLIQDFELFAFAEIFNVSADDFNEKDAG